MNENTQFNTTQRLNKISSELLSHEDNDKYDSLQKFSCETSLSCSSPSVSLTISMSSPLKITTSKPMSTTVTTTTMNNSPKSSSSSSSSSSLSPSSSSILSSMNSLKRARFDSNQTNNNNIDNKSFSPNQFTCPCGRTMLDSSEFMEHACQCHEFMMTASNFAEVIAKNTAMVMSSEWNKCFQSANLNNFSMNSVRNNNNNNDNNVLVKNNANNKGNSSLFQSALDLSFRSNEIPSSCVSSTSSPSIISSLNNYYNNSNNNTTNNRHVSSHVSCPQCSFTSTDISVLCKHFELEHDNTGQFTCSKCNESYDQLIYYLKHQLFDNCLNSSDCFDRFSSPTTITNTNTIITTDTSSSLKTMITSTNTDSMMSSSDTPNYYSIKNNQDHEKDHRHYQSQQQQYQNSHRQRYNHLKQMHHLPRNHSSSSSPTSSPSRIRSSNDQYNDVSMLDKKLVCNACHQTGFQHTGELINHLTECPKFISFTGNIGNIIGSTITNESNTTNTTATNITDIINHSNSNNMNSLNLHIKNTQTPSTINQSQQYNHGTCVSPLLNGLINNSTFDFEKNFNDLLKSSCGSSTFHNYLTTTNTTTNNNNNNHFSSSSRFPCNSTLSDNNDSNNKTYHHKNVNLCSPYSSHGINSQNSYSHFLSNLQSLGKSYYNDTTKSSSTTLSLDSSIDSPMIELNLSNNDTYNCTTSVNSLHMSEFNTNQHINSHPAPLYHGRMEELTTDHHHDQHHRQSHQSQQNNSMNNLPPPSSSTTTSIENITDLSRPFKCCHCIKAFKSKALLDQHMHIHYPPKYTCRYCAKKYRWPPVFYHHQRTCKKRPTTSTACTNNDINNTTITVTMSTNTTHNNQHNSNNSSMKRNHHHHHHNLNYSDIRKNFPITSDSLTSLRSINSQMNDTFHNSLTSLRNPNGNLNGSETLSSYGHSLCLPPFNSNSSASLMELSNNSNIFHNNSNNNNHDDDATLMPPPHLNNFTALAAAAAAAAAMSMHFQIPPFSNIPPPPLGFTNSFTSSSTATTTATSLTMVSPYHHPMNTPSPSISLPSLPTSSSSTRLQFGSNLFNQSLSSFSSINRSNLLPPFTTQSIFQSSHFVPPLLVPNSNESIDCNYLPEPSSFQPELNFPFNSVLSSIASKLTTTASSSSPMSSLSSPTKNNHAIDASNSQVNILNNLLCVCGVRFNEISSYISHISNCNFLKNLVLQSFSSTLSQSEFPVLPTTTTVTTLLSSPSSSLSSPSPPMMTSYKQTSSLFPFDTTVISNKFHPQDDVQNDDTHHEQPGKCKNSIVNNLITSNDNCNSLNETNIQQESLKHEEKINEKTNYNEISTFVQIDQLNSSKNNHETDQLHKNNIDLKESPNEPNRSPLNSLYQIENNLLSDRQITINSSNNSFITTMVNVLTNTSSMTDNQCPELQDSPCQIPKNHLNSPSQTSSFQISSSPTIDVIDHDRLDYHSQSNNSNNSPENINSISTTISTLVNSPKSCYHCGKEFSSRLSLKQHVEGKHSTEGKYCCPGCSKRYRWGASYYYHKKSCPAVREQSPVPSDIVNQLSLSGSEDNSSLSSINSPISPSKIKPTEEYNFEEKYIEGVEDEKGEEDQNCGDNDYDNDPHIEDDENENEKKEEQEDEFKHDSNNSFKLCISHKKYLRSSSRNSDLRRNSMKGSYSNKNDNLNNTSSIQSKFIKHQIQNKQICQTIKEDSLICDINAFPGYNHFIHM
ncbi:unnamed protein product [Schistosoma haematobium]|nr:unnamed protein product [Schistosoma haematobium]